MIWIAVDAMGGDTAPGHRRGRRAGGGPPLRPRRGAGRTGRAHRARELARHPGVDRDRGSAWSMRRRRRDGRIAGSGAAPEARCVDQGGGRSRGARRGGGAVQRRAHRRHGHGRARRVRHARRRRSSGAGGDDPDPARTGGAARRRRQRRVPPASPAAVRGDGQRLRPRGVRHRSAPRRRCCRSARRRRKGTS